MPDYPGRLGGGLGQAQGPSGDVPPSAYRRKQGQPSLPSTGWCNALGQRDIQEPRGGNREGSGSQRGPRSSMRLLWAVSLAPAGRAQADGALGTKRHGGGGGVLAVGAKLDLWPSTPSFPGAIASGIRCKFDCWKGSPGAQRGDSFPETPTSDHPSSVRPHPACLENLGSNSFLAQDSTLRS